ncbi:restriction endonuclease [Streptomyces rubrogriseus]
MQRDGCQDAQRVGGRGDLGADVKAIDPYGRRWVIQCKHRRNGAHGTPVGTPALQVLNVHRPPGPRRRRRGHRHQRPVTAPAVTFAKQQRLRILSTCPWACSLSRGTDRNPGAPAAYQRPGLRRLPETAVADCLQASALGGELLKHAEDRVRVIETDEFHRPFQLVHVAPGGVLGERVAGQHHGRLGHQNQWFLAGPVDGDRNGEYVPLRVSGRELLPSTAHLISRL